MNNLDFIKDYDFGNLVARLQREGLSAEEATTSTEQLRAFYMLRAMYFDMPIGLVAWEGMEPAWHAHILDTREYPRFCHLAFGRMLHHDPNAYGTPAFRTGWAKTVELAAKHFRIFLDKNPEARESNSGKVWNMAAFCNEPLDPEVPLGINNVRAA